MQNNKKLQSLSVFFPCFNEEENIPIFVGQVLEILPQFAKKFEIIIVNDGSKDNSLKIANKLAKIHPEIRVINHVKNQGYGAALKSGFKASQYEWVFFTDGDLQFDLKQLADFLPFTDKYAVIIGYRKKRAEGFRRALIAKTLKITMDILYRLHVKDIDCAFKLIKNDAMQNMHLVSSGAFTSTELLYRLKKKGIKFKELPVDHFLRKYGNPTGNSLRVMVRGVKETMMLYLYLKFGLFSHHYKTSVEN